MAEKKRSTGKKTRNFIPGPTRNTTWSAYMQGTDIEWMDGPEARKLAKVFGNAFPQWLIESDPWREITGKHFKTLRQDVMYLSVAQAAAYLRVTQYELRAWESGKKELPFAAYESLRLLCRTADYRLSHKSWDGWFINRKTGELISPDLGKLEVTPADINSIPRLYQELSMLQCQVDQQAKKIDALEAENARLRDQTHYREVTAELETMQGRIGALLEGIRTAEVFPFSKPAEETPLRAVA